LASRDQLRTGTQDLGWMNGSDEDAFFHVLVQNLYM